MIMERTIENYINIMKEKRNNTWRQSEWQTLWFQIRIAEDIKDFIEWKNNI